jgi:hypothetical protein
VKLIQQQQQKFMYSHYSLNQASEENASRHGIRPIYHCRMTFGEYADKSRA